MQRYFFAGYLFCGGLWAWPAFGAYAKPRHCTINYCTFCYTALLGSFIFSRRVWGTSNMIMNMKQHAYTRQWSTGKMERKGCLHMYVEDLLRESPPAKEYPAEAVMQEISWARDWELWNHPELWNASKLSRPKWFRKVWNSAGFVLGSTKPRSPPFFD